MAPEGGEIIPDLRQFRHEFHSYNLLLVPEYRFRTPGSQFLGLISWLPVPFMGHKIGDLLLWLFQPYLPYNPFTAVFLFCSKFRKKYVVIRSIMQTIFFAPLWIGASKCPRVSGPRCLVCHLPLLVALQTPAFDGNK